MVSKRRTYTREFKVETVNLITGSNQSVAEVARDLEIHPTTLYKWIRQHRGKVTSSSRDCGEASNMSLSTSRSF